MIHSITFLKEVQLQFTIHKCKKILHSADILESEQRKVIKQNFNDTVYKIYNITITK